MSRTRTILILLSLTSVACQNAKEQPLSGERLDDRRVMARMIPIYQEMTRQEWVQRKQSGFVPEDSPTLTDAHRAMFHAALIALREQEPGVRQAMFRMISADEDGGYLVTIVCLKDFEYEGQILDPISVTHAVVQIRPDGSVHFLPQA